MTLERNPSPRAHGEVLQGSFFLRKKTLGDLASGYSNSDFAIASTTATRNLRIKHESTMSLRLGLLLLLYLLPAWRAASGQAVPTATAPGAYIAVGGGYSLYKPDYGNGTLGGPSFYVDLNFRRQIGLEAEARWLNQHQYEDIHQSTYLIGPRIQIRRGRFSPYVKLLVGDGHLNFPYNYAQGSYFVLAPGGGIDYNVTENLKVRVIDFEYQQWPQFTFGTITPYGISAGVSLRIFNGSGEVGSGHRRLH